MAFCQAVSNGCFPNKNHEVQYQNAVGSDLKPFHRSVFDASHHPLKEDL